MKRAAACMMAAALVAGTAAGCALPGRSQPRSATPLTASASQTEPDAFPERRVETANGPDRAAQREAEAAPSGSALSKFFGRRGAPTPQPVPLPRTDLSDGGGDHAAAERELPSDF